MRKLVTVSLVTICIAAGASRLTATATATAGAKASEDHPLAPPDVSVDLMTSAGVALVRGTWRFADAQPVEVDFRAPGTDKKPSGPPNRTFDFAPRAGARDFDDSDWEIVEPAALVDRRSSGRVCFGWYRIRVTVPERIGAVSTAGATIVFETVVDDYAEVWVDGELPRELGQSGGSLIKGFNAPNRLVIARDAQPGSTIQLAVFGINGPLSDPPANFVWMRSAKLDVYGEPHAVAPHEVAITIERKDPALESVVPASTKLEKVADGFVFTEGPVWSPEGTLMFSDPNRNRIYRWTPGAPSGRVDVLREASGYTGDDARAYRQPGSNGLALDARGRLTICEHGQRCVSRIEPDGTRIVLAERYAGRRLNSPNDLVYRSDGALFFTDPPFGLPNVHEDARRELPFSGVYCWKDERLSLVSGGLRGPNGIALSPDETTLYVANWDEAKKVVLRYALAKDGSASSGELFFDMQAAPEPEALDGIEVDRAGNLFVSGPGGLWILSPQGVHLGTVRGPERPANFAWGDADLRTLYWTAHGGLYRMRVATGGVQARTSAG